MKFITRTPEALKAKWLYFKGQVAEVNTSVLDLYEQKRTEDQKLSGEQILTEAEQLALAQMPSETQSLVNTLQNKFKNPEDLKKASNLKETREAVQKMIFKVIDEGVSMHSDWGSNVTQLKEDVKESKQDAILTIKDTKRGLSTAEHVLAQYKREASQLAKLRDDTNRTKGEGFLWLKKTDIAGSSERALFDGFSKIAEAEIQAVLEKFRDKNTSAEALHKDNKRVLESGFKALAPEDKAAFVKLADKEVKNKGATDEFSGAPDVLKAVVTGVDVLQRVEIFPAMLDPGKAALLQGSSDKVDQETVRFQQREDFIRTNTTIAFNKANIDGIKAELTDSKADTNFSEDSLGSLNGEITLFFRAAGINVSHFYKLGTTKLGPEELNEYENFTVLFQALVNKKTEINKAPRNLKKKILAACNWLENIDVSEKKEGYSEDFIDVKEKIKEWSNYTQADLGGIYSTSDLNSIDPADLVSINKAEGELGLIKKELASKKDLTVTEKNILENFIKEAETVLKKLKDLSTKWEQQKGSLSKDKKELKKKEKSKQAEIDALKNQHKLIEDKITDITSGLGSTTAPSGTLKEKIDLEILIATVETELEDLDTKYHHIFVPHPATGFMSINTKDPDYKKYKKEQNDLNSKIATAKSKLSLANSNLEGLKKEVTDLTRQKKDKDLEINLATSQRKQITDELAALSTFDPDTAEDYEFTDPNIFLAEIEATINTLVSEVNDTKYDDKIKDNITSETAIAAHFVYNSMRQNQDLYRERFTALQGEQFGILKSLSSGRGVKIKATNYLHGTDLPDSYALASTFDISKAIVLETTDDAVVLLDKSTSPNSVIVVQESEGKYQVLKLPAPNGYDGSTSLPPDFFPQNAIAVGEIIQLTPA